MVITLNELSHLRDTGFGQPWPRHGLHLLYWFAHEYIDLRYGEIVPKFRPQSGDFGFHMYLNKIEDEEDHIVPIQNLPYYEVGNLNYSGADKLPNYVRGNYSHNTPNSNKDRIIVRLDNNGNVNRVYVTEHSDPKRFDTSRTYRVSQGLLQIIKNKSQEQFLSDTREQRVTVTQSVGFTPHARPQRPPENDSWCAIL